MNKINFYIMDSEKSYADKLSNYIFNEYSNNFIVKTYYSLDKIESLLKEDKIKSNDIFLIEKGLYNKLDIKLSQNIIILSENNSGEEINKYLPGNKIIEKVLKLYKEGEFNNDKIEFKSISNEALTIGFYSPIGGIGVTTLSLLSSLVSKDKNLKTLYISFEMNTSLDMMLKKEINQTLSKYFYYLLFDKTVLIEKLKKEDFPEYNGMKYIFPFESMLDYEDINEKNISDFIELLKKHTNFDRIILDIPSIIDRKIFAIFRKLNKLIFVSGRKPSDYYKMMNFETEYNRLDDEKFINRNSILILNKYRENDYLQENKLNPFNLDIVKIPWFNNLLEIEKKKYKFNINNELRYALELIVDRL